MVEINLETVEERVRDLLAPSGMLSFGWFGDGDKIGLLIGNVGSSLWSRFSESDEIRDGLPDPMNRWTVAVITAAAQQLDAEIRYPFGEIVWPFQKYASAATGMRQSPVGLMIHPKYGLWTAFRAALMFSNWDLPEAPVWQEHPCDTCLEKPCLTSCPVGAFTGQGYDVQSCRSHVGSPAGSACFTGGCVARHSCPVGPEYANSQDHQAFHMRAFV